MLEMLKHADMQTKIKADTFSLQQSEVALTNGLLDASSGVDASCSAVLASAQQSCAECGGLAPTQSRLI